MPRICYVRKEFSQDHVQVIADANGIIRSYADQGFTLTLRQLYYQFVARDLIPNTKQDYKRLGAIISAARLAGLIDWEAVEDRTREMKENSHWAEPADIVATAAKQYHEDLWLNQEYRPEIWVEKDALVGVLKPVCNALDVPYFSCRGYTSQTEMWEGAMRLLEWRENGQRPIIFHFGDHDPSGIDMTRDIRDRLALFFTHHGFEPPTVVRVALTMEQIEEFGPPPNPTKLTDSRAAAYIEEYGDDSWELDALEPATIDRLVRESIAGIVEADKMADARSDMETSRKTLNRISEFWGDVEEVVNQYEEPDE